MPEIDDNFSGEFIQEVASGKVIINFVNGQKDGKTTFVSPENIILSEINYKNDVIDGVVKQYYPNGKILSVIEYKKGKQDGRFTTYFENGIEQIQTEYKNGLQHGHFKAFDEFGDVILECDYLDGVKTGKNLVYYPKAQGGGIYELSFFENGLLSGDKVSFYSSGEVMSITPYVEGKAQGYTKNYDKSGSEITAKL